MDPVFEYIYANDIERLKTAALNAATVNQTDENGMTPLAFAAAKASNTEILSYLLDSGADVNFKDVFSMTPLMYAAMNPNAEMAETLLENGARLSDKDENGMTPLLWAAKENENPAVCALLVDCGADVSERDAKFNVNALMIAAKENENPC